VLKLTKAGEYAVRAVLHLAAQPEGRISDRDSVAQAEAIPPSFLAKILQRLTATGIIRSYKGACGGFSLAVPASEITLLHVIKAVEGPISLHHCLEYSNGCYMRSSCPLYPVWKRAQKSLEEIFSTVTVAELAHNWPLQGCKK
jgi:Rrf2 family iron-sulfur cluster assembly transcriptional regulator